MSFKTRVFIKQAAEKSRALRIAYIILSTLRTRLRFALGSIASLSGSTYHHLTVEQSLAYINLVFQDFLDYGGLNEKNLAGKRFLELGPGDNVGVALRLLALGAREAVCVDKFYSTHDIEHERRIYLALREQLSARERELFDQAVTLEPTLVFNPEKIRYVYGVGAQDADRVLEPQSFDLILSRAVLQEIYEIDRAFACMDRLLRPGGSMVHKIDLRDYGMFSSCGFHPREFLTISDPLYYLMASDTDKPNRRMLDYYRDKMGQMGYQAQLYIVGVVEEDAYRAVQTEIRPHKTSLEYKVDYGDRHVSSIQRIRPRLAARFHRLTDEDLLAAGLFLVATKPR